MPPHDMRHLMGDYESDLVPLPMAHLQQRPTHENSSTREGNCIRLALRCDPDTERELLLRDVRREPAPNLRSKSSGFILLNQRDSFKESRRQLAAQTPLRTQGILLGSADQVEGVLGLSRFLAKPESNRFKQSFHDGMPPGGLLYDLMFIPAVSKTKVFAISALFFVSWSIAIAENAAATAPLSSPWQKKLIEYEWDSQTPAFIAEHIREMEKRPFDGLIFRLAAGTDVLDPKPWDESKLAADLEAIPKIEWKNFTDNFVAMLAASNEDWENDEQWTNILKHAQQMSRTARLAKCVGVCFDAEPYGENPWAYKKEPGTDTRKFEEFEGMVRRRGSESMRAIL